MKLPTKLALAVVAVATLLGGGTSAWGYWPGTDISGTTVAPVSVINAPTAPTIATRNDALIVRWAATTLSSGTAVTGYLVKRYSSPGNVLQTITNTCSGMITNTGCIEMAVPLGTWTYTITPQFIKGTGSGWQGAESAKSAPVASDGVPSTNAVWMWITP